MITQNMFYGTFEMWDGFTPSSTTEELALQSLHTRKPDNQDSRALRYLKENWQSIYKSSCENKNVLNRFSYIIKHLQNYFGHFQYDPVKYFLIRKLVFPPYLYKLLFGVFNLLISFLAVSLTSFPLADALVFNVAITFVFAIVAFD